MLKRTMTDWIRPTVSASQTTQLKLYNSLTKKKEVFIPIRGNRVTWYQCGPTVYDASHMGHARAYLTFDIMRRVLSDYFKYNVYQVMNITDIDDKIILRARQSYLFDEYKAQVLQRLDHVEWRKVGGHIEQLLINYARSNLLDKVNGADTHNMTGDQSAASLTVESIVNQLKSKDQELSLAVGEKYVMRKSLIIAVSEALKQTDFSDSAQFTSLLDTAKDIIAAHLDSEKGSGVTDHHIFKSLTVFWEGEYFKDMKALNVQGPDVLTRVTEYVPEIIDFVDKIIQNGYAYESDGNVYFDVQKYKQSHQYAKISPQSQGNASLLNEGEGALSSTTTSGKRSPQDFALWKASKPGEPYWESKWGRGRPGWHIECSAMASHVLGQQMDIHSGGIDLCFPHHDNELAQSEAHYECQQWVNYFLHAGHLHIEGLKMSKSLKNFITIQDALKQYTPDQIRLLFLLHPWNSVLDYKTSSMNEVQAAEATLRKYLTNVRAWQLQHKMSQVNLSANDGNQSAPGHNFNDGERELIEGLYVKQTAVHEALCDNLNTPQVIKELLDLVSKTNLYIAQQEQSKMQPNVEVLTSVASYIQRMLSVFGLQTFEKSAAGISSIDSQNSQSKDDMVLPYLTALANYRSENRSIIAQGIAALNQEDLVKARQIFQDLLNLSDQLRDIDLPALGVQLEDKDGGKYMIKLKDPKQLQQELQDKLAKEQEKKKAKEMQAQLAQQKLMEKLQKGKTKPEDLFKTDQYSQWDADGIPTADAEGVEIGKSRRKKLIKEQELQKKLHQEYLQWQTSQQKQEQKQ
ncbi:hypothetical protein MP228_008075 [Amoeboaphelidium protococcarum]|nr:hypothetical protein MP228_008075 [Amoeboaphelidium protococcarum]